MRIGFDANSLTGLSGFGIIKYITKIVEYADSKKIDCFLFSRNDLGVKIKGKHIHSVREKGDNLSKPYWDQFVVPKLIKKYKIDLYHAPGNMGLPACRKNLCKMVLTVHDIAPVAIPEYYKQASREIYLEYQSYPGISSRMADKVIAVSNSTKKDICRIFDISSKKIKVIYQGDDEKIRQNLDQIKLEKLQQRYNFGADYIIYVSEIALRKNHKRLICAFAEFKKKNKNDFKLLFAGWAHEEFTAPLKKLIREKGMEKDIIFLDFVLEDDLSVLLSHARFMIYPSLYEGFGLPILEAMACGCPVACSNTSSMPEIAGGSAYVFDPYNINSIAKAIEFSLSDKAWRDEAVKKGFLRVKDFSWEKTQKETFEVYRKLLKI